jgi:hypothetical protein
VTTDIPWEKAITQVLMDHEGAMHYREIAEAVFADGLRGNVGATPAQTVAAIISTSIKKRGSASAFVRTGLGQYMLRENVDQSAEIDEPDEPTSQIEDVETQESGGIVRAFAMYWSRDYVDWKSTPALLGQQLKDAQEVDFGNQVGVYVLHDARETVYVGRAEDSLGRRLKAHVSDRLSGRWDRFSWFGLLTVNDDGTLGELPTSSASPHDWIVTMESLLIEGLEPPQNRKRGDEFNAIEYIQVLDPELQKRDVKDLFAELQEKLG